jgi:hypothetical protein
MARSITSIKWLTPTAIKRNFDVQDLIAFILPTTYAYYDGIPKIVDCPKNIIIATSVLVFILLFLFKLYKSFSDKEKAISEVLETGYFKNFFYPFATTITDKLQHGQKLTINFKDKNKPPIQTDDILIRVILPRSKHILEETMKQIDTMTKDATIDNGPWVKIQALENGRVVVYECPRTLCTIEKHLTNGNEQYTNTDSLKFHRYFIGKFMRDYKVTVPNFTISSSI